MTPKFKISYATITKNVANTSSFSTAAVLGSANIVAVKSPKTNNIPPLSGEYLFQQSNN